MRRKVAFIIERILRLGKNDIRIVAAAVAAVSITPLIVLGMIHVGCFVLKIPLIGRGREALATRMSLRGIGCAMVILNMRKILRFLI